MIARTEITVRLMEKEVLAYIRNNSGAERLTLNEIASAIGCARMTVWRTTKRLEEAGLIRKVGRRGRAGIRYEEVDA